MGWGESRQCVDVACPHSCLSPVKGRGVPERVEVISKKAAAMRLFVWALHREGAAPGHGRACVRSGAAAPPLCGAALTFCLASVAKNAPAMAVRTARFDEMAASTWFNAATVAKNAAAMARAAARVAVAAAAMRLSGARAGVARPVIAAGSGRNAIATQAGGVRPRPNPPPQAGEGADSSPLEIHANPVAQSGEPIATTWAQLHATWTQPLTSAASCTPATARPDGSAASANDASHAIAAGDEHAIDLPPGTVAAHAAPGKLRSKMRRYRYASLVCGGLSGKRLAAAANSRSPTCVSACALSPSIQP